MPRPVLLQIDRNIRVPSFKMFIAAFRSLSWAALEAAEQQARRTIRDSNVIAAPQRNACAFLASRL